MVIFSTDQIHRSTLYCFSPFRTLVSINSLLVLLLNNITQYYSDIVRYFDVVLVAIFVVS